jgi:hypothetical protein
VNEAWRAYSAQDGSMDETCVDSTRSNGVMTHRNECCLLNLDLVLVVEVGGGDLMEQGAAQETEVTSVRAQEHDQEVGRIFKGRSSHLYATHVEDDELSAEGGSIAEAQEQPCPETCCLTCGPESRA